MYGQRTRLLRVEGDIDSLHTWKYKSCVERVGGCMHACTHAPEQTGNGAEYCNDAECVEMDDICT